MAGKCCGIARDPNRLVPKRESGVFGSTHALAERA